MNQENLRLPFEGVRVLEMGHTVMGPTCGLVLADMGAEVIKIERAPKGDHTRQLPGFASGFFSYFNRNKKSLMLDLKSDRGKEILRKLIGVSDVFIENFGPGAVARLGFGYNEAAKLNPRLVYCSLKGFMKGPYEHRPALDEVVQMMGGLAYMTGPPGRPLRAGASVIDIMGGSYGVIGIITALYQREKTGKGQFIEATLYESTAFLMGQHMAYSGLTEKPVPPMPARVSAWSVYKLFESKDDEMIFIGITSDAQWKRFCEIFNLRDLAQDERLATNSSRVAEHEWLIPELGKVFRKYDKSEIVEFCEKASIPFADIAKPHELFDDPQLNEGQSLVETTFPGGKKVKLPKIPLRVNSYDFGLRCDPPDIGQGSLEILKSIGVTDEEIDELNTAGIIGSKP